MSRERAAPFLDAIPEEMHYADDGCEASPHCLQCPLPQCKHDDPAWYRSFRHKSRDAAIADARRSAPIRAVAIMFRLSPRTINRVLVRVLA